MPVNAYLVLRNESAGAGHLDSFWQTAAEAAIRGADSADLTQIAGMVSVPDEVVPGWYYDGSTFLVEGPVTGLVLVDRRRSHLIPVLRVLERVEGLAAWTAGELNGIDRDDFSVRAKSYSRWVEMMTRATAVDANLSNEATYSVLLREASHSARVWYWLHWAGGPGADGWKGAEWAGQSTFGESRLGWQWYSTTGPDAFDPTVRIENAYVLTPNTRGAVSGPQVIEGGQNPALDLNLNWISYLS